MYGLFVIFLFYFLGNFLSSLTGGVIPGSVIGMVLLFFALLSGIIDPQRVRPVATAITNYMALYFVPVGVGLMVSFDYISRVWPVIVLSSAISMVLVLIATGGTYQIMERWRK